MRDRRHPLLHRAWVLGITHQRIDEFFELDVSGLRELREGVQAGPAGLLPDGRTATEELEAVYERLQPIREEQDALWQALKEELLANGILLLTVDELDPRQRQATRAYFEDQVYPVLTPLAIDPAHKFPHISHRSINFAVALNDPDLGPRYARVKVPDNLPRFVPVPPPEGAREVETGDGVAPADLPGVAGVDHRGLPRPALRRGARDGALPVPRHPGRRPGDPGARRGEPAQRRAGEPAGALLRLRRALRVHRGHAGRSCAPC